MNLDWKSQGAAWQGHLCTCSWQRCAHGWISRASGRVQRSLAWRRKVGGRQLRQWGSQEGRSTWLQHFFQLRGLPVTPGGLGRLRNLSAFQFLHVSPHTCCPTPNSAGLTWPLPSAVPSMHCTPRPTHAQSSRAPVDLTAPGRQKASVGCTPRLGEVGLRSVVEPGSCP